MLFKSTRSASAYVRATRAARVKRESFIVLVARYRAENYLVLGKLEHEQCANVQLSDLPTIYFFGNFSLRTVSHILSNSYMVNAGTGN